MYLVRLGYRIVNLEFLIEAADSERGAPPYEVPAGKIRVSIYPGEAFEVGGEDAARLRRHLDGNLRPPPAAAGGEAGGEIQKVRPKGARASTQIASSPKSRPKEE